ncbi:hypothetical protein [Streptomyces sp. NPDC001340]
MGDIGPRELISLADFGGNSVTVNWIADHRQRLHQMMNHWVRMLSA